MCLVNLRISTVDSIQMCVLQLLLVRIDCPRYHEERQKIMNSTEVLEELNTYSDLYSYLSNHTGLTIRDPDDVQSIYSTLKAEVGT